jgi:MFS family permease
MHRAPNRAVRGRGEIARKPEVPSGFSSSLSVFALYCDNESMFQKIRHFFFKYERYVSPVTLVTGFIFDTIMLRRIDVLFSNALLISYLVISALSIILLNIRETRRTRAETEHSETMHVILIFMMQFCLGGLFSAAFLFYSKSGSLIASWPFLLMIFAYVIGNELLRKNYVRLGFQIAVFFTALFSYLIFFLPVILHKMGDAIFLLSGLASLIITGLFIYMLSWFAPERTRKSAPIVILSLAGLFAIINLLYFTNLIPPIPLAMKDAGIYRSISLLQDGTYFVVGEQHNWFGLLKREQVVHLVPGEPLYALSSVFAPTALATEIVHVWKYYDPDEQEWVVATAITLPIVGGREGGYRTFSEKDNLFPGKWRVDVVTPRGQLIGRLAFDIRLSTGNEEVVTVIK